MLRHHPDLDEVLIFPRKRISDGLRAGRLVPVAKQLWALRRELRSRRFDLAIDFHGILKSGWLSWWSGARTRVGYGAPFGREGGWVFSNRRARFEPVAASRYERNAGLLRFIGLEVVAGAGLPAPESRCDVSQQVILIHPGSSDRAAHKRYPTVGYVELVTRLADECGLAFQIMQGTEEAERRLARSIVDACGGRAELAPTTPTIPELIEQLGRARLLIGSDSGPLHLASLTGTPVVQILGPTHPIENQPWQETPYRQVRVPLACSPCRRGCPPAPCTSAIPPELVSAAVLELLEQRAREEGRESRTSRSHLRLVSAS